MCTQKLKLTQTRQSRVWGRRPPCSQIWRDDLQTPRSWTSGRSRSESWSPYPLGFPALAERQTLHLIHINRRCMRYKTSIRTYQIRKLLYNRQGIDHTRTSDSKKVFMNEVSLDKLFISSVDVIEAKPEEQSWDSNSKYSLEVWWKQAQ